MQSTAQQWLVYKLTGSQLSLGLVTFASFFPVLILSLFMGVIVDRFQRRRLLVITQSWFMLMAGILALLTFLNIIQYWHILVLAVLLGIANALDMPTRQAFYVDMVEKDDLFNAIALNSSVFNGARIIGPAIGGLMVATLGEAPAFAANAISYGAVIAGLLLMRLPTPKQPSTDNSGLSDLKQGLSYLAHERNILGLVSMIALFSLFGFPYIVLLPVFARDILDIGVEGFGTLMAAQGTGALFAALTLAFQGDRRHKGRLLLLNRGMITIALLGLSLSRIPALSMLALVIAGYALITQLAVTNTLIQLLVPDELRGRVVSAFTWALGGFWPIGSLMFGFLGDTFGAPNAVLIAAISSILITILGQSLFPETTKLN